MCGFWDDDASNDWHDFNNEVDQTLPSFVASWVDNAIAGTKAANNNKKLIDTSICVVYLGSATCNKTVNTKSPCDDENYMGSQQLKFCGEMNQLAFESCFAVRIICLLI
jgi:hypothetical protein